jgi:hypothetical protein
MNNEWVHVIIGTRCSWLHGDVRGFRSRRHRIHSSGDYKNPPPRDEHQGLRAYHQQRSDGPISFDGHWRIVVLKEFVMKMQSLDHRIIAAAIGERHLHALCHLPSNYTDVKKEVGKCKQAASYRIRAKIPGSIWAAGLQNKRIRDKQHLHSTYDYVRFKQDPGAVVWSHRPDEDWIQFPEVGIVTMASAQQRIRVFATAQTPASERSEDPDPY